MPFYCRLGDPHKNHLERSWYLSSDTRVGLQGGSLYGLQNSHDGKRCRVKKWPCLDSLVISDPRVSLRWVDLCGLHTLMNFLSCSMFSRVKWHLIGPRPERPEFTHFLAQEIPGYVRTTECEAWNYRSWHRIVLPADSDLESVRKKVRP